MKIKTKIISANMGLMAIIMVTTVYLIPIIPIVICFEYYFITVTKHKGLRPYRFLTSIIFTFCPIINFITAINIQMEAMMGVFNWPNEWEEKKGIRSNDYYQIGYYPQEGIIIRSITKAGLSIILSLCQTEPD